MPSAATYWRRATLSLLVLVAFCSSGGCTRYFYRKQADCEAFTLVYKKSRDPRWELLDYTVYSRPDSRFFDPTNLDRPPMPIDDIAAHKLMHCVDCKNGYPCWHANGDTPFVANPHWKEFLPINENGVLELDLQGAMHLGRVHSRDYQSQLETLYLSALDVTFERFRFDVQFFGTQGGGNFNQGENFQVLGPPAAGRAAGSSILTTTNALSANRLLASGGQFTTEILNTFMWQFAGPNQSNPLTIGSFGFVQPLLRLGSRAVVLERLTLAERTLLGNVRAMERYRQGFFVQIYNGRAAPPGPSRVGGLTGGAGLNGFSGVGTNGFGRIGGVAQNTAGGGGFTGGTGAAQANGFLGLLQDVLNIEILDANVAALRDSLAQLNSAYDAGRIDRFQVDLARQALFSSQSRLLTLRAQFYSDLDTQKVSWGLPPDVPIRLNDPLLDRFELLDVNLTDLQNRIGDLLDELRSPDVADASLAELLDRSERARSAAAAHVAVVEDDFEKLLAAKPARLRDLDRLRRRSEAEGVQVGPLAFSRESFLARVAELETDLKFLVDRFERSSALLQALPQPEAVGAEAIADLRQRTTKLVTELSGQMQELMLVQARARLDTLTLTPIELEHREALEIAREFRLDWMNARAAVVDSWRLIQFNANLLRSGLNLVVNGSLGTTPQQLLQLGGSNGQLNVGVQFAAPLTRLEERNNYRQSLISFQQSRRNYMQYVDSINLSLRNTIRTVRLNQLNFELRRGAVAIAINQVDLTRLRLVQPPRPGETTQFSVTTARDLVDSLTNLLNVQTDFLSVWVNTEVQRANLDFDLGTMLLTDEGMWIDPGPITADLITDRHRVDRSQEEIGGAGLQLPEPGAGPDELPGGNPTTGSSTTRAIPLMADEVIALIERDIQFEATRELIRQDEFEVPTGPYLTADSTVETDTNAAADTESESVHNAVISHESETTSGSTGTWQGAGGAAFWEANRPHIELVGALEGDDAPLPAEASRIPVNLRPREPNSTSSAALAEEEAPLPP
ncbi:MAG: hypothetical protein K2Y37_14065 [Pirellulales bacterium]|nr:hypothetical protein [Pirellulales bacterium]